MRDNNYDKDNRTGRKNEKRKENDENKLKKLTKKNKSIYCTVLNLKKFSWVFNEEKSFKKEINRIHNLTILTKRVLEFRLLIYKVSESKIS